MRAGWCGVFLLTLWVAVGKVRASGAVPPDEFAPAVTVYAALPCLLGLSLLLLAFGVWRRREWPHRLGFLLCAGGALRPVLLVPGMLLVVVGSARVLLEGEREALPQPRARGLVRSLLALSALAAAATLALALVESFLYVPAFVPRLVTPGQLADYRLALGGLSLHFGVQVALFAVAGLWTASLLARGRPLLFCLLLGQLCGAVLVFVTRLTLGDELDQIGVGVEVVLMGVAFGGLFSFTVWRRVRDGMHADTFELSAAFFRYSLVPPVRFHTSLTLLAGLVLFALLGGLLYPTLEDFRAEIFDSHATLAVLLGTLLLFVVAPRRRPATASALLLGAMLSLSLTLGSDSRVRIVAHEYSRFGALAANSWLERALDPFPRIGYAAVKGVEFRHHGPGEDHLAGGPRLLGRPPILFLIWDGARADRTSLFGYERKTTPNLERLARESIVFPRAYANATATTASVRKLLTGSYATRFMLAPSHEPFLTKELSELGYSRFVITVTGTDHNGVSGEAFERGWEADPDQFVRILTDHPDADKPDGPKTRKVIEILAGLEELDATFVYLHLTGTHFPWFDTSFGLSESDRYDSEMRACDALLGDLLDFLEGREYVLVMTADHGTGLGEHGRIAGFYPYEEQIRVPLLMRIPGVEPRVVDDPVAHIDVAPTIMSLLRPGAPHRFHGRSLLPLLEGKRLSPRPIVVFGAFRDCYALIDGEGRWKLFHDRGRRYEALFDLRDDPAELRNRIGDEEDRALAMRDLLAAFLWQGRDSYGNPYHYRDWQGPR